MNTNRQVCAAAAGLVAAWLIAVPASAQSFLVHEYDTTAGTASQVSIANLQTNWVVTGITNPQVGVQLATWTPGENSMIQMGSATTASYCCDFQQVSTVALSKNRVITIGVDYGSPMLVTSWSVSSTGAVTVGSTMEFEPSFGFVSATKLDNNRLVVAFANSSNELQLDLLSVDSSGSIDEVTSSTLDTVAGGFGVTAVTSSEIVTATCGSLCGESELRLDSWHVGPKAIKHQHKTNLGVFATVNITAWGDPGNVVTAVVNVSGDTELLYYTVDTKTGVFTPQNPDSAVETNYPSDGVVVSTIGNGVFTATIQPGQQQWDAGVWGVNESLGQVISADGDGILSGTSYPAAAPLSTSEYYTVTAISNGDGNLQLDVWYFYSIQ